MKNVKNARCANYIQIDNIVRQIQATKEIIILPSKQAFEKYNWTRKYFIEKPQEGYFVWVKGKINFPLIICISICEKKISQNLSNLIIVEDGLKIKLNGICNALNNNLSGIHKSVGKIILKQNAILEYQHTHKWGKDDFVKTNYDFILEKNANLIYNYKNLFSPKKSFLNSNIFCNEKSSANLNIALNAIDSKIQIQDNIFLKKKQSKGIIRFRFVGRKNSSIKSISKIIAEESCKGHLDCQGLVLDKNTIIDLVPQLINKNKDAILTHEASVGKIADEQINYLRCKGLTETQAIDLIVGGFFKKIML